MDMASFQHVTPPLRLFHGPDSLAQLGRELERVKSSRAVIFCGGSLAREAALLGRVKAAMGERCSGVFSGVEAHSPIPAVIAAAQELKRLQADAVVAVGGGSAIVTARAASIILAEGREVRELSTTLDDKGALRSPKLLAPKLPQLVIPTTPTTAAVKAGSAVFDPDAKKRFALFDPKARALAIFVDPGMLLSAPRGLVVGSALNTFVIAMEGLMSRSGNPLAEALLMHALRLLGQRLPDASRLDDAAVRGELMLAAVLAGQGTDHTGAGITTVLAHAIGARHELDNGIVNAIVLPHALRFNADAAAVGLAKVAAALGHPPGEATAARQMVIEKVQSISRALEVPRRLRDVGIPAEALTAVADIAMGDWFLRGNPRRVGDSKELLTVLEQAW